MGKHKNISRLIQKNLNPSQFSYDIKYTEKAGHATEIAQCAIKQKYDIIIAVGGDGTVNEIAKVLIGSNTALGIIPLGSGNGLARHLQIPLEADKAVALLNQENDKWIDTVKINDDFFLCVAGMGFDAQVSDAFSQLQSRGFIAYVKTFLQKFPEYQPKEYHLVIDGKHFITKAFLVSFANSSQYGNNAYIAPKAKIDDGFLDLAILQAFPSYLLPKLTYLLFKQKLDREEKYFSQIQCKDVLIEGDNLQLHIDGEPFLAENPVHIRMMPSSLKVIVPLDP
ncbi:MAG: diacylglycerol kinase family lipid kinase [Simkaniaceae bacterium]